MSTQPFAINTLRPLAEAPYLLTVSEAAAYLRRTVRCLARWETAGKIRMLRPCGGFPLVERTELERLLGEQA